MQMQIRMFSEQMVGMPRTFLTEIQLIKVLFPVSAQNDFINGSLEVEGAVGIVDPVRQLIEKEELWGQVGKKKCYRW